MQDRDPAQAVELVRALCDQLREMIHHLAWVEGDVLGPNSHAMRLQAAALRRDIAEAQMHVDRLQRRYLIGSDRSQERPARRTAASRAVPARWVTAEPPGARSAWRMSRLGDAT
ncbi:hypothetical protein [Mycobacterium sp.]|uniref:hypothetical protein n=1 Tax=Mycobacterium sp. TaxID=1785 RepID=UPI003F9C7DFD